MQGFAVVVVGVELLQGQALFVLLLLVLFLLALAMSCLPGGGQRIAARIYYGGQVSK